MSGTKITVKKKDLITKIKENKALHVEEFNQAVVDYKVEALRQLNEQISEVANGGLEAKLDLVTPIDNSSEYDDLIDMFGWTTKKEIELEKHEYNQYIKDDTQSSIHAKFQNTFYSSTH